MAEKMRKYEAESLSGLSLRRDPKSGVAASRPDLLQQLEGEFPELSAADREQLLQSVGPFSRDLLKRLIENLKRT